jgi:hypothetical protein
MNNKVLKIVTQSFKFNLNDIGIPLNNPSIRRNLPNSNIFMTPVLSLYDPLHWIVLLFPRGEEGYKIGLS